MPRQPAVYILANRKKGVLYTGVTSAVKQRVLEHKEDRHQGFTSRYGIKTLVYVSFYPSMEQAIRREKQIKRWKRIWKIQLIEENNPEWRDLYDDLF